ncbi:MAG: undecaprenyl-diphosphate phosphatase [Planctomycetota bacterium]
MSDAVSTGEPGPAAEGLRAAATQALSWLEATLLGVVEGLTEFLPVSSTGHLIVTQRALGLEEGPATNAFAIGIQLGAITAVLVLYWRRLWAAASTVARPEPGRPNLLWQIGIAAVPAVVVGLLFEDWIDEHLFSARVVAATLVGGGVLLLWLERHLRDRPPRTEEFSQMTYRVALWIGLWQCLALVPGTSRSGATIGGALMHGVSRTAAAEFSFLVGLPILYGASFWKLYKARELLTGDMVAPFAVGTGVSFVAALLVVRPFVAFLRRHDFVPFAWYRIVAGGALLALIEAGYLGS